MKYTIRMKINGELAARFLSETARRVYNETDPLAIYEYEKDDQKLYAMDGAFGHFEDLSFSELQNELESIGNLVFTPYGDEVDFDLAVALMDDEIRERLHNELAPCSRQDFFDAYCDAHEEKYGEEFKLP